MGALCRIALLLLFLVSVSSVACAANGATNPAASPDVKTSVAFGSLTLAWVAATMQLVVIPFYSKSESLHKDYASNGKMDSAKASIESGKIIPALASMFHLAVEQQPDKRKRPEHEIEDLLHAAEFAPDLQIAQEGMREIESLNSQYQLLRRTSAYTWKCGLLHVLSTLLITGVYLFAIPRYPRMDIALWLLIGFWGLSLCGSIWLFFRFHGKMDQFNQSLETTPNQEQ